MAGISNAFLAIAIAGGHWFSFMLAPADDFKEFRPYASEDLTYLYDQQTIMTMGEWASPDARATAARLIVFRDLSKERAVQMFEQVIKKRHWNEHILGHGDEYTGYPGPRGSGLKPPYVGESITLTFDSQQEMHVVEFRFMSPFEIQLLHAKQVGKGPVLRTKRGG